MNFIERNCYRYLLLLYLLEPLFRDNSPFIRILFYAISLIFAGYLIYLVINFYRRVKYNQWTKRLPSMEFILMDIYICGLGILGQYLAAAEMSDFFNKITPWLFILIYRLMNLFDSKGSRKDFDD